MNAVFRELRYEDTDKMMELFKELKYEDAGVSFTEYIDENKIKQWVNSTKEIVYVAVNEEDILAVIKGRREEKESKKHAVFLTAAVNKRYRQNHIAKELTEYALGKFKEQGIKIARAYIYSDNKPSINTILSCGFQVSGCVHMHHYDSKTGKYVDDLIFHKLL